MPTVNCLIDARGLRTRISCHAFREAVEQIVATKEPQTFDELLGLLPPVYQWHLANCGTNRRRQIRARRRGKDQVSCYSITAALLDSIQLQPPTNRHD